MSHVIPKIKLIRLFTCCEASIVCQSLYLWAKRKKTHSPVAIAEIIANSFPAARHHPTCNTNPAENKQAISKRIDDLEKRFDTLSAQVEKLRRLILSR